MTNGEKNGIIYDSQARQKFVEELASGRKVWARFKAEEVAASKGIRHEGLWKYILSLESARIHGCGIERREGKGFTAAERDCEERRFIAGMGSRVGWDPRDGIKVDEKYLSRGAESIVYRKDDVTVVKMREIHPINLEHMVETLAGIVYHNYLFPKDAYTLSDILRWEHDGYVSQFLVLEQAFVKPLTRDGFVVGPTFGQIREALRTTGQEFTFFGEGHSARVSDADGDEEGGSEESDDSVVGAAKFIAANGDYAIYDFKPGANTFIDAATGEVRFIDPRVKLNDPSEGFRYSSIGRRALRNDTSLFGVL